MNQEAQRVRDVFVAAVKRGKIVLRPAELINCPEEQEVVDRICMEHEQGKGLREIARLLDSKGISCRGRRWHHSTIKAIVSRIGGDCGRVTSRADPRKRSDEVLSARDRRSRSFKMRYTHTLPGI